MIYPNKLTNQLTFLRNPGALYWAKANQVRERYVQLGRDRLQKEINLVAAEKWIGYKIIDSAYSIVLRDFVFVNIDSDEKLAIVALGSDSIRK